MFWSCLVWSPAFASFRPPCPRSPGAHRLAHQLDSRRVVRPVHLRMAIDAAPGEQEARSAGAAARQPGRRARHGGMARHRMALLAQQRRILLQPRLIDRTVRVMAQGAVLGHRRMLPQERAALFRVAGVAGLVHRRLDQHPACWSNHARRGSRCRPSCRSAPDASTAW